MVARGVIVANQREHSRGHTLCDGVSQPVDFLRNAYASDGDIRTACDHVSERRIGDRGHHGHYRAGQTDAQYLAGNMLFDREGFRVRRDNGFCGCDRESQENTPSQSVWKAW